MAEETPENSVYSSSPQLKNPMATTAKRNWRHAVRRTKSISDPWEEFHIESIPTRKARRHIYDPRKRVWLKDKNHIVVKMQSEPFAHGAMRECFRMKKLSQFSHQPDWQNASNYVAKRYMKEQPRTVYKQDVQLQMDAKLWGEKYSLKNPPKKVDFFQAYLIEFFDDENGEENDEEEEEMNDRRQLFCVEHFVEGEYVKYNSNSGFVSDMKRLTPQAFSHFTFENSGHQLIVVDVQGVGDLYTDPQIHTADQVEYGEGNLGTRGMALFFSSHLCNPLCSALKLSQFDLSQNEIDRLRTQQWKSSSATSSTTFKPTRAVASIASNSLKLPPSCDQQVESTVEAFQRIQLDLQLSPPSVEDALSYNDLESPLLERAAPFEEPLSLSRGKEAVHYQACSASVVRESKTNSPQQFKQNGVLLILGQVHFDLAYYHSIGRFTSEPDMEGAMFHLVKAGDCQLPRALCLLSAIYLQRPHNELEELSVTPSTDNEYKGRSYLLQSAEAGVRTAMIEVAREYEKEGFVTSPNTNKSPDWHQAARWYKAALDTPLSKEEEDNTALTDPEYLLLSQLARLFAEGGQGLGSPDHQQAGDYYQQAADAAMAAMKGRLATRYYQLAEEEWGQLPDDPS